MSSSYSDPSCPKCIGQAKIDSRVAANAQYRFKNSGALIRLLRIDAAPATFSTASGRKTTHQTHQLFFTSKKSRGAGCIVWNHGEWTCVLGVQEVSSSSVILS